MAATGSWYIGTDNSVHIVGVKDESGAFINAATTFTGVLQDGRGNIISGDDSVIFTYVPASQGNWNGLVPANLTLKPGSIYHLIVTIVAAGRTLTGRVSLPAAWFQL